MFCVRVVFRLIFQDGPEMATFHFGANFGPDHSGENESFQAENLGLTLYLLGFKGNLQKIYISQHIGIFSWKIWIFTS